MSCCKKSQSSIRIVKSCCASQGPQGPQGEVGPQGPSDGPQGATGAQGPTGAQGVASAADFAEFYALMPGDNTATIGIGAPLSLPQDGATSAGSIARVGGTSDVSFNLAIAGFYEVAWQVSVAEAAQMALYVDSGSAVGTSGGQITHTVVGRATGTSQLSGHTIIQTLSINTQISLRNAGSAAALTITPNAGGTDAVSANIVIKRIA